MLKLPFTSVVSYHVNPMTCGVAKFSQQLADRLGVPLRPLARPSLWGSHPLLSLKWAELEPNFHIFTRHNCHPAQGTVSADVWKVCTNLTYGVFWHDAGDAYVTEHAQEVFYADPSLGSPGLWCPSLITPRKRPLRLFSFGMAHKLQTDKYRRVRELLDAAGQPYHLRVSVGLHEGTSLDGAEQHFDALKAIMGPEHVTILGILSDDAVSEELANADYVLAFFEKGVRANNTTVHAAIAAGKTVITNRDDQSPDVQDTLNVCSLGAWPVVRRSEYSWNNLILEMQHICANSVSRTA